MKQALVFVVILFASPAFADPEHAVVRIPSHGASGTVIATGGPDAQHPNGWSIILSCWHAFPGEAGRRPIAIDVPVPITATPKKVGIDLLAVGNQHADLSLIKLNFGPLPYVSPVAPKGFRPAECWSVGYDEMKMPPQKRPATIQRGEFGITLTRERPWHGRSGGALIDAKTGYLVGVVSAYSGPSNHQETHPNSHGIYISHATIYSWLKTKGYLIEEDGTILPPSPAPQQPQYRQAQPFQQRTPWQQPLGRDCPT